MSRVYRARTIKRARRTKAQIEQLDQQIFEVLEADHPQSARHTFYVLRDDEPPIARAALEVRGRLSDPCRIAA